mmetsp:Transcript_30482/g.34112  ORF Transcript_30482/g.34112 Transcript_30482/m.34112 type:complete len:204 (-) Transcript_30482:348-959(-)
MPQPNFMPRSGGWRWTRTTDHEETTRWTNKTQVSIRQQRERPSSRGRTRIPPPTTESGLGSGGGPPGGAGDVGAVIDEGISRRRAELRRLQEKSKRQRNAMQRSSPNNISMSSPRVHEGEELKSATSAAAPSTSQPPPVPIRPAVAFLRHQSDLFPSVPKSPSVKKETFHEEESAQIAAFAKMLRPSIETAIMMGIRREQKTQ